MCAIGVFEGEGSALNERFCSQSCVLHVYPGTGASTPAVAASSKGPVANSSKDSTNIWTGSDSDFLPSPEIASTSDTAVSERPVKRRKTAAKVKRTKALESTTIRVDGCLDTVLPPTPTSPVSDLGVPLSVSHSRKIGATDSVWDLIHVLDKPYTKRNPWKPSAQVYRNICLLCCEKIKGRKKITPYSWEDALRCTKNTSNAKDHIKTKHADHPLAVLAEQTTTQKAKAGIVNAEAGAEEVLDLTNDSKADTTTTFSATTTTSTTGSSVVDIAAKSPQRFFKANEKTLHVLISKWLITQGIGFPACRSAPFEEMMRAATGNPAFPMLSRDRHDRLLQGQFQLFCDLVGELLTSEYEKACRLPYLNLLHDIWTSCGKDRIVGASVAFIDTSWRFRFIAMLATVKNEGHNAPLVAKVIESGFTAKYDIGINAMTRSTMSDTTPSARNVADHIDSEQEDCSMHLLNLCIGYGLGLKDNIQTNSVWNAACHSWDKVVTIVTPGGSLEDGEALSYPELDPMVDKDVRVAYTCKLIRRSMVNYAAFEAYFQSTKDSSSVWSNLSPDDWTLATEMVAVTHFIANLALIETQSENLVSSYMVVFRRLAEKKLKSFKFDAMVVEAPRAKDANEASHCRAVKTLDQFSEAGKTSLRRTLLQLQARFPKVTKEAMACILLDPRTKSSAKKIAAVGNIPRKEEKSIYKNGLGYLRAEHRKVFAQMAKLGKMSLSPPSSQSSLLSQDVNSPFSSPSSTGWDDEDELLLGAPIRTSKTREEVKE
ncbi:hypothetical protein F444_22296 [Phytophthora nicotianae P1976]|uniref:Uncharacterized protein n=1 Tax=Phytophthora nicotianae P1976 TaxID=1317066 RepID=A0A080YY77_PHYNI|nr:hypothetical protein F444_22296 [Phytophthora nicotianae P1976]